MFSQAGDVKLIFMLTTSRHQAALGGPALVRARTMENAIKSSLIDCLVNVCKLKIITRATAGVLHSSQKYGPLPTPIDDPPPSSLVRPH